MHWLLLGMGIGAGIVLAIAAWAIVDIWLEGDWSKVWARNFNRGAHRGRYRKDE